MAKRGRKASEPRGSTSNGLDTEAMDGFIERIEDLDKEGRKMHSEYMAERRSLNDDKKEAYTRAKEAGIPAEVLRVTIDQRALDRRAEALPDKLGVDNRYLFDDYMARWNAIKRGEADPGPGVLVKAPVVERVAAIGRPAEPEKEEA